MQQGKLSGYVSVSFRYGGGMSYDLEAVEFGGHYVYDSCHVAAFSGVYTPPLLSIATYPRMTSDELLDKLRDFYPGDIPPEMERDKEEILGLVSDAIYREVESDFERYVEG